MKHLLFVLIFIPLLAYTQNDDTSKVYQLQSVTVREKNERPKQYILGTYNKHTKLIGRNDFVMNCKNQIAVYIASDKSNSIVKNILIHVKRLDKDSLYSVILYKAEIKKYKNKKYHLPKKVIFSYQLKGKMVKQLKNIDFSDLKIKIPTQGLYVAFEGVHFSFKTTGSVKSRLTLMKIGCGKYKYKWINIYSNKGTENARFGLRMQRP